MKLIEIANKIDRTEKNESYINMNRIGEVLNLELYYAKQNRLKAYWVGGWCCTDTWVGYRMYFLDGQPVCYSEQRGRKCDEKFFWFSRELALKTRDYLLSLMEKDEDFLKFDIVDINKDIEDGYYLDFNDQVIFKNRATLNGEKVEILEYIEDEKWKYVCEKCRVQFMNGEEEIVGMNELKFKYNLIEE